MPRTGRETARRWQEVHEARRALDGAVLDDPDATAARDRLLAAEDALDFGDEEGLPPADLAADQKVAVLLPVRLETRFRARAGGTWLLALRIFPEPVAFDQRPRPAPGQTRTGETEGRALEAFRAAAGAGLDTDEGRAAFTRLAAQVGAARAAWLVTHVGPGEDVPAPAPPLAVLPRRLGVWLARGGGAPVRVHTLALDPEAIAAQSTLEHVVADATFDGAWWNSFEAAKKVGLALELVLPRADDLDLVMVAGVGDADAGALWRAHAESGRLGVLAPGTPTNSVDGGATAKTAPGAEEWLALLRRPGWAQAGTRTLGLALAGDAAALPALPGGDVDVRSMPQRAAMLLLPAVLGRALHDQWRLGEEGHAAARWAARWLLPGGPCPTLRLDDIPYGVLPAAPSPDAWVAASDDPAIEQTLLRRAQRAVGLATAAAESGGTIMGAAPARVLELLTATPVSTSWTARAAMSLPLLDVANAGVALDDAHDVVKLFEADARAALDAGFGPQEPFVAVSDARAIPRARTDGDRLDLRALEALAHAPWTGPPDGARERQDYLGEVLLGARRPRGRHLVELLVDASLVLTHARLASLLNGGDGGVDLFEEKALADLVMGAAPAAGRDAVEASGPLGAEIVRAWFDTRDALEELLRDARRAPELVDAAAGLLDLGSHRVDPWLTGAADRRARRLARAGVPFVVGAYGWVDAPRPAALDPRPAPGPTDRGLLHAPGADHVAAAALLRDRSCAAPSPQTDVALDSGRIRAALRLAAYVRAGITHNEALGREVERIAADREAVRALRAAFAPAGGGGRQVCDGEAVIAALASPAGVPPKLAAVGLTPTQHAEIAALTDAVDAYADLLLTDATFAFVAGHTGQAAPAMDAAGGLGPPPELRALRTPRRGAGVNTRLLGVLPAAPAAANAGPAGLAAPELAAALTARLGEPDAWTWQTSGPGGPSSVSLADFGLDPIDVLALEDETLHALLGQGAPLRSTGGDERVAAARRLAAALAGRGVAPPGAPPLDDARADALAARAASDVARLLQPVEGDPGVGALIVAARWGVPLGPEAFAPGAASGATRATALAAAVAELAARLARDDAARPLAARVANLSAARVPPPPAVAGTPAALGLAAATRRATLDTDWLEIVSAVRPEAAAVEAYQLTPGPGAGPLHGFTAGLSPWHTPSADHALSIVAYGPAGVMAGPQVVAWTVGEWSEVVPGTEHQTHAAFGWNAPDSRAPQAVLVAVPPELSRALSEDDVAATVAWTRQLARARAVAPSELRAAGVAAELTPLTLLHASGALRVDPSGLGPDVGPGGFMTYERVEPAPSTDTLAGLQARLGDPLWLLGRQWQLGEHRGEDASSPVELACATSSVPLRSTDRQVGRPASPAGAIDPATVPAEAIIEADPSSWWTMGRRVRLGRAAAAPLDARGVPADRRAAQSFGPLPPPYHELAGSLDGRALYQSGLLAGDALWAEVPLTAPDHWRADRLDHVAAFGAGAARVHVDGHDGGEVDWWSADASGAAAAKPVERSVVPGRLRHPGAAQPRYWQLEDAGPDPSAFPPDAARWATALWTDLVTSAGGDWFTAPVPAATAEIGSIVTLHAARVRDSFDEWWPLAFPPEVGAPAGAGRPWSLYRTKGLPAGALVLWPTAVSPLGSAPLDEIVFGVDEDADLCWAVELRVDGFTLDTGPAVAPPAGEAAAYVALPSWGLPAHGHPYRLENRGPEGRLFVQGQVADLAQLPPRLRAGPRTSLLNGGARAGRGHELQPSAVPSVGVRLVSRWRLARATDGRPVLWLQRERTPLGAGPASHLRFDVPVPDREVQGG